MQERGHKLALHRHGNGRTIAQKRRDLIAQVERMALSDLAQVSSRLKALHAELDRVEGARVTYYDLAKSVGVAHRTLQSWENGEVENRDGKGYDKLARFYTKKLGRSITRKWILFGDSAGRGGEKPMERQNGGQPTESPLQDQIEAYYTELSDSLDRLHAEIADLRKLVEPAGRRRTDNDS